jgi:hypothetical protein
MEDAPNMATFNYLRKGFSEPPTTYYLRPFSIEFDKNTQTQEDCYFDEPEVEVLINRCKIYGKPLLFCKKNS